MTKVLKVSGELFRSATIECDSVCAETKTLKMSMSSDVPYKRRSWDGEEYYEVLDHSPGGMDESRLKAGIPILFNHDRNQHLGRATGYVNDGKKCTLEVKFSESEFAQEKFRDALAGVLPDTSVGYQIVSDGEQIGKKDGVPIYKFKWLPYEASLVTIPADTSVGVGRSEPQPEATTVNIKQEKTMSEPAPEAPKINVVQERQSAVAEYQARCAKINDFTAGLKNPQWREAAQAIAKKHIATSEPDFDAFRAEALNAFDGVVKVDAGNGEIGMSKKDMSQYSLVRAIACLANKQPLSGFEKECSDAQAKIMRRETQGFFIPQDIFNERALTTNVFSAAGALVGTTLQSGSLVELLRNKMRVMEMGARQLSGLVGNIAIPTQTGGATAYWLAETGTTTESALAVGQISLTPHRLSAATAFSNQLLAQASIDVESFVRNDLMTILALAKDKAVLMGTGASGEPLGIVNTSNLSTSVTLANAGTITYAEALRFEKNVADNNADEGLLGFLTTPTVRAGTKATAKISAANSLPVWQDDNTILGYKARTTLQNSSAATVIFGNWGDVIIGDWAGNEVIVDPYSLSMQGQVRVVMNQLCDNVLRHSKSFAVSTN